MFKEDKMLVTEFNLSNPVPEREEDWVPYDLVWEFHDLLYLIQGHFKNGNQYWKDILNKIIKFFFYFLNRQEKISFRKAVWEGYMSQIEKCESCGKDLDKRSDSIIGWIYYEKGDIEEEVFFCSPTCMVLKCVEYGYLPSNIEFIAKSIVRQAEDELESKKQPGTCPKCGSDNIEVLWTDCGVCCLLCLNCEETWTESHEE